MRPKYVRLLTVTVAVVVATLSMTTSAMGWQKWKSDSDPGNTEPPAAPWVPLPALPSLAVGQSIWIAMDGYYCSIYTLAWWIEVVVPAGGATFQVSDWHGYYNNGASQSATRLVSSGVVPGPPFRQRWNFESNPEPDWEVVKITCTSGQQDTIEVDINANSYAFVTPHVDGWNVSFDTVRYGAPYDTVLLTEIWVFHESSMVDIAVAPSISAPPGSGTWSYEFVYVDPDGNPCPQGAVRWSTDGNGIEAQQDFGIAFTMAGPVDGLYTLYVYDAVEGEYERFTIPVTTRPIPTLTEWGMIIFCVLLFGWMAWVIVRRRRRVTAGM